MTINPKNAKPDQPYEVDLDGERYVAMRNNPRQEHSEWRLLPEPGVQALWAGDGAVKNLVPLVPARPFTRDDLPSAAWLCRGLPEESEARYWTSHTLTKVLEHLNSQGGVPAGAGKSCCEEAAQSAAEVDTLTRERDEARDVAARNNAKVAVLARERDELQAKLDDLTMTVKELAPAEQRPTLDREAVRKVVGKHCGALGGYYMNMLVNDLMALVPAAEGWPEWLGSRPVLRVPVRNVDDNWTFHDGNGCIDGDVSEQSCREAIEDRLADAVKWAGILSAIESEQAATGDEARIEEQAERLYLSTQDELCVVWESLTERMKNGFRAAIRAGWTKEAGE